MIRPKTAMPNRTWIARTGCIQVILEAIIVVSRGLSAWDSSRDVSF